MVRPLYAQCHSRFSRIHADLRIALGWLQHVSPMDVVGQRFWKYPVAPLAHLFVDAAGKSSRCAAVLFIDGAVYFTDGVPNVEILDKVSE